MADDKAAESASTSSPAPAADTGKLKLFLIINLVVVLASLGVSVFSFLKLKQPQVADIEATGVNGEASKDGHAPATDGHGTNVQVVEPGESHKLNLTRFVINLANSGGAATVSASFQIVFTPESDVEYAKGLQAKMRDVTISLISSKSPQEMATVKGREELKEQMIVAINSFLNSKATVKEILFLEFLLNTGA